MDIITVYDNSSWGKAPTILLQAEAGEVLFCADDRPSWLAKAIRGL